MSQDDLQVVKSQMDQEAEIMKQSMARQVAAEEAAQEAEEDSPSGEPRESPLRTASTAARGMSCLSHGLQGQISISGPCWKVFCAADSPPMFAAMMASACMSLKRLLLTLYESC